MTKSNEPNTDKTIEQSAKEYAESCDNESGGFLTNQLIAIRTKAFLAGAKLCEQRERDLVEALEKIENGTDEFGDLSAYDMSIILLKALNKYRGTK